MLHYYHLIQNETLQPRLFGNTKKSPEILSCVRAPCLCRKGSFTIITENKPKSSKISNQNRTEGVQGSILLQRDREGGTSPAHEGSITLIRQQRIHPAHPPAALQPLCTASQLLLSPVPSPKISTSSSKPHHFVQSTLRAGLVLGSAFHWPHVWGSRAPGAT